MQLNITFCTHVVYYTCLCSIKMLVPFLYIFRMWIFFRQSTKTVRYLFMIAPVSMTGRKTNIPQALLAANPEQKSCLKDESF